MKYNEEHGIIPQQIKRDIKTALVNASEERMAVEAKNVSTAYIPQENEPAFAADPIILHMSKKQIEKAIADNTALMKDAATRLDFLQAAQYRDEIAKLQELLVSHSGA